VKERVRKGHCFREGTAERFLEALTSAEENFLQTVRVAVVVAHPDDETIGIGGQLRRIPNATIVHVTDGAPRDGADARLAGFVDWQSYAAGRRLELQAAMQEVGFDADRLLTLGFADKEGALHLAEIVGRLIGILDDQGTELVVTHAYEGGHADHDAAAFAVHAAELSRRAGKSAPEIVEMPFYHWRDGQLVAQRFLAASAQPLEIAIKLDAESLSRKKRMLAAYKSQAATLASFSSDAERFRRAPAYDFTSAANDSEAGYERLTPGIDAARWKKLVQQARLQLGLE